MNDKNPTPTNENQEAGQEFGKDSLKKRLESTQYKKINYDLYSDFNRIRSDMILFDILYRLWEKNSIFMESDGFTVQEIITHLQKRCDHVVCKVLAEIGKKSPDFVKNLIDQYPNEYETSERTKQKIKRTIFENSIRNLPEGEQQKKRIEYNSNECKIIIPSSIEELVKFHFGRIVLAQSTISKAFKTLCKKPVWCNDISFVICKEKTQYMLIRHSKGNIESISDLQREDLERKLKFCKPELKRQTPIVFATYEDYPSIIGYDIGEKNVVIHVKTDSNTLEKKFLKKSQRIQTVLTDALGDGIFQVTRKAGKVIIFLNTAHECFRINSEILSNLFKKDINIDDYLKDTFE